jgi:hypothetical protein
MQEWIEQEYPARAFRGRRAERRRSQYGRSLGGAYDFEEPGEWETDFDDEFGWLPSLDSIKKTVSSWNPFASAPALPAPSAPTPLPAPAPATPAPAASASAFLKDNVGLQNAYLTPSKPVFIEAGWPSTRKRLGETFNRLGGLIDALARDRVIEIAPVLAVWQVESGGKQHIANQAIIRFENHKLYEFWGKANKATYDQYFKHNASQPWLDHQIRESPNQAFATLHTGNQSDEYRALNLAVRLAGKRIGVQCISIGGPQIMGFNYKYLGYASPEAMYDALQASERAHVLGFFDFCRNYPAPKAGDLFEYIRKHDWANLARYYNGSGQVPTYSAWFKDAYNEALNLPIRKGTIGEFEYGDASLRAWEDRYEDEYGRAYAGEFEGLNEYGGAYAGEADEWEWEADDAAAAGAPDAAGGDASAAEPAEPAATDAAADAPATTTADGHTVTISRVVLRDLINRLARLRTRALLPQHVQRGPERAVKRKVGQLARNSRRVGSVKHRKTGRRYPVFQGRTRRGTYNMVARPKRNGQHEILMITPAS